MSWILKEFANLLVCFIHSRIPAFDLDEKFQVIDFLPQVHYWRESQLLSLPHGPGVTYLRIQKYQFQEGPFTSQDYKILKEKFPNLKLLVLPYGSIVNVQPSEFNIEVQTTSSKFDDLLNKFPSLTLTYWIKAAKEQH